MKNKFGWDVRKLDDIAKICLGLTYTPTYVEKGIPFLSVKDITKGNISFENTKFISEDEFLNSPSGAKPQKGDILFGRVGTIGQPQIVEEDIEFCIFVSLGFLKIKDTNSLNTFVRYWMLSNSFTYQVQENIQGIAIKNLNTGWLKNFNLPVPPLPTQQQIVSELDALSEIISKKKQQLEELDKLAQATFYDMFGDPVTNEKGWEVDSILNVAPIKAYKGVINPIGGKFWLLNLDMVESNTGKILSMNYVDKSEIGNSTTTFNGDNVLYSKLRPYLNKVVKPESSGYATSELIPLLPNKKVLNTFFLTQLLRSSFFVNYIQEKVAGAKMPRVSMDIFRAFKVILPPLNLQDEFATKIESIESQKSLITQSIAEVQQLFDSRMDKYFG